MSYLIDRKEIARALGLSCDMVRKNERRWGFHKYKVSFNRNVVRYRRKEVWSIMVARGWVE